jgi:hypothetical protein
MYIINENENGALDFTVNDLECIVKHCKDVEYFSEAEYVKRFQKFMIHKLNK